MSEQLGKLRKVAEGALRTIDRRECEVPKADHSRQKAWWQGYRQCIDDVEDFVNKHHEKEGTA
jgi:hypothetical protein